MHLLVAWFRCLYCLFEFIQLAGGLAVERGCKEGDGRSVGGGGDAEMADRGVGRRGRRLAGTEVGGGGVEAGA